MAEVKAYEVSGPVAVIKTADGSERYMYRGAIISEPVFTAESIAHNLSVGLLTETDALEGEVPSGDPSAEWTVKQLTAYAGTLDIDLEGATKKDDILAVIVAASAK